jgi:hypothetical protein
MRWHDLELTYQLDVKYYYNKRINIQIASLFAPHTMI